MNIWVYISWIGLLATAVIIKVAYFPSTPQPAPEHYRAKASLPQYYQLKEKDLVLNKENGALPAEEIDRLVGLHLLNIKKPNDPITAEDLSQLPVLQHHHPDEVVFILPLQKEEQELSQLVQPGDWVAICSGSEGEKGRVARCSDSISIVAAHSATARVPGNFWLVKVHRKRATEIDHLITSRHRYILLLSVK